MGVMIAGLLGGCAARPDVVSQRQHGINDRYVVSQMPAVYAAIAQQDEENRSKLSLEHATRWSKSNLAQIASRMAYCFGLTDEQREMMVILRQLNPDTIERGEDGRVYNTGAVLGRNDWVSLDATLSCRKTAVMHESTPRVQRGENQAATTPRVVSTYRVPANTTFDARFGHVYNTLTLSGTIDLARGDLGDSAGKAAATPVDAALAVRKHGNTLHLTLDKASPFNALRLDARGRGVMGMALKVDSDAAIFAGVVYVGSTIYVEIPVEVNASWTRLRLASPITRPGNELTPSREATLLAADGPFHDKEKNDDPWADANANGIVDGADALLRIYADDMKDRGWPGF